MKVYEAPVLYVDEYAPDTMIASGMFGGNPKKGNPDNNQNCWGCDTSAWAWDGYDNICLYYPGDWKDQLEMGGDLVYIYNNVCGDDPTYNP